MKKIILPIMSVLISSVASTTTISCSKSVAKQEESNNKVLIDDWNSHFSNDCELMANFNLNDKMKNLFDKEYIWNNVKDFFSFDNSGKTKEIIENTYELTWIQGSPSLINGDDSIQSNIDHIRVSKTGVYGLSIVVGNKKWHSDYEKTNSYSDLDKLNKSLNEVKIIISKSLITV
ncbi:hypothetical protein [Mesoplasma lactucae]|uniref:Uncharacterized protein n=1 Tax=Mesoplasma lactucae ATCC 49193 TaxID=81460 RepID=A0A291IS24_9MOLU|nr:hypothetical protein [Mesoplasma lactucae]ATG97506.1 hypothetical protein CP520_01930 [Mesoplasma lactucae ATCC 49193]ATZ20038.1 hypothetical protein MLACT_v1c02160 [Mesoplasma lactucae ATCC 49193]MCL8217011.1 hypothetical protein [Mesoplasma lactucae ATCC 49193]